MNKPILFAFLYIFLLGIGNIVNAQNTLASISGKVIDGEEKPVAGATITVHNTSTGFKSSTITNNSGIYTFNELPLGGPYVVSITSIGYKDEQQSNILLSQGDVIKINSILETTANSLENVIVTVGLKSKIENLGAATSVSSRTMTQLPVNGRNFANLTDLSPLARGNSISGQLGSSTNFTIDGMNSKNPTSAGPTTSRSGAPYSISIEAVREFKVVTNQYDVTFGRSGGGTVSAVTKSGTNDFHGTVFGYGRADQLSSQYDIRGNKRNNDYSTYQYGFSLGGPIVKDKLHFFVAWDHQQDRRSLVIADIQTPADEARFNISQKVLDSVIDISRSNYGVSSKPQYGSFSKKRGSDAAFARIDWQLNGKNLLTIRNNFTNDVNKLGLTDNTNISLYESTGNDFNKDNSLLATLRTTINSKVTNEIKLQHLYTYQSSEPGDELPSKNIPRAILENVTSVIDGSVKRTNIQFGGHRFAQESFKNNVLQLIDNLYYNTEKFKYTFGIDLMYTNGKSVYGSEVNGRFHYAMANSLQNLINNTPYRYYREVPLMDDISVTSNIINVGIYGQLQTKLAMGLDFMGGLRFDYAHYPSAPYNDLVFQELGLKTNNKIKSFIIQPRLQFTWDVNELHTDYIRLGAGVFASDLNNYMVINNLTFDGKHLATVDVQGIDVPKPDFTIYRNDPSKTPQLDKFQIPTINMNGKNVKVPTIYKANLSYTKFFTARLRAGVTAYMTLGRNNYFYIDKNMVADPYFRISNEDNRGVYIPLDKMPSNTQSPDWKQGRISSKLGRVLELNSIGKVNQFAIVVDGAWQFYKDGEIYASYTWNDTKDNATYNGNVANTATLVLPVKDNQRDLSNISYSDNQFRHKIVFYTVSPTVKGFTLSIRYSGIGGTRYTLRSGVNSNADFVVSDNDLGYIFDINNTSISENIRNGLKTILDNPNASKSIKDYITKYSGKIAERNGGINGFYGIWDARVAWKLKFAKTTNAIEFSADLFNVMNLVNKSKGTYKNLGSQALYSNGGFDKTTATYKYNVNTAGIVTPSGDPWQIQIGIRYSF